LDFEQFPAPPEGVLTCEMMTEQPALRVQMYQRVSCLPGKEYWSWHTPGKEWSKSFDTSDTSVVRSGYVSDVSDRAVVSFVH